MTRVKTNLQFPANLSVGTESIYHHLENLADAVYTPINADFQKLESDYIKLSFNYCHKVIRHHSKTFSIASSLLDNDRKNAVAALYSFCRITDDIIDKDLQNKVDLLNSWQINVKSHIPNIADPVQLAWLHTRAKYQIPEAYMDQLIAGVFMDIHKRNYKTYSELVQYCYHVASTVGLMSMHIIGFTDRRAIPYAVKMGVALQLTNIIRDVGQDYEMGRIYIPQEELDEFSVTENHFRERINDAAWKKLMSFQIKRARSLFQQSWEGLTYLESKGKRSISAAAILYREILKMVERNHYDNHNFRAYVSRKRKLFLLSKLIVN